MDYKELKRLMREVVGAVTNLPITGKVISIEGDTCTVEILSGLRLSDVKLQATSNGAANHTTLIPIVGSTVLMLSLSGDVDNLTVIKVDEVEQMKYSQQGLEVLIDSKDKKVSIRNEEVSLVEILGDLSDLLKEFKVYTPVGPSGVPLPDVITKIEGFETKFKTLLK
ncbi:hypothetical protein [Leeuwenhoekiella parthenopeia]|uniref:Uncharacterized protein n=1 Tax=Leeuwenhoekiella parthenopeia TaxID=2890320 RepID=A0ABS8GMY2_9FLAO|nr:hypothetical protein [Leeuwenhoekiella parthenopeia]MCC4211347.1 hypothetical protein [Leeuwenhoekiella parthenopeia]